MERSLYSATYKENHTLMLIGVAGGSGFIGRALCRRLVNAGHQVTVLTRNQGEARRRLVSHASTARWQGNEESRDHLGMILEGCEAVINLSGYPVATSRWTRDVQDLIRRSRIGTTELLVSALGGLSQKPRVLINASAVGYYGPRGQESLNEDAQSGRGFLAAMCRAWEAAASDTERLGIRVVIPRIGVVLGLQGGALARMLPIFRLGLGGPLGSGRQWMSWIHVEDLVEAMVFLLEHEDLHGPFNATAPSPVTNQEFAETLARVLGRPAWLRTPAAILKLAYGQMAEELLLTGQRVIPRRLSASGFEFRHPYLRDALRNLLQQR